jgi:hypothetical protein
MSVCSLELCLSLISINSQKKYRLELNGAIWETPYLFYVWEHRSYHKPATCILVEVFHCFLQFIQANGRIVPQISPEELPSTLHSKSSFTSHPTFPHCIVWITDSFIIYIMSIGFEDFLFFFGYNDLPFNEKLIIFWKSHFNFQCQRQPSKKLAWSMQQAPWTRLKALYPKRYNSSFSCGIKISFKENHPT